MASLLSQAFTFTGHQTFPLRSGWLKKGLDAIQTPQFGGGEFFRRDDALVILGVGKNMVASIRYWLLVTRMAEETASRGRPMIPTPLGQALFGSPSDPRSGWDPFLEDDASLWLLHWNLAGPGGSAATWAWTVYRLRESVFTKEQLQEAILKWTLLETTRPPSPETLSRDIDCLLHAYVGSNTQKASEESLDCPLAGLGLIRPAFDRYYRLEVGPRPHLPLEVFIYALLKFWDWYQPAAETLAARELIYEEGSPGRVFRLDEESVLSCLDALEVETQGQLRFEDTPLVRQVIRRSSPAMTEREWLQRLYDD